MTRVAVCALVACLVGCSPAPDEVPEFDRSRLDALNEQAGDTLLRAERAWSSAEAGSPAAVEAAARFGKLALAYSLDEWALTAFDWALSHETDRLDWRYYRAQALHALGRTEESVPALREFVDDAPSNSAARIVLIQWLLEAGRLEDAAELTAGRAVPADNEAAWLAVRGRLALAQDKHRMAAELLQDALAADPDATLLRYPLGLALRALGREDEAAAMLESRGTTPPRLADGMMAAVDAMRVDPQALRTQAGDAARAGNHARAIELYRQSLKGEEHLDTRINLAISQMRAGDPAAAEAGLVEILEAHPEQARAAFALGALRAGQGRDLEAIDAYRAALAADPSLIDARFNLANALRRSGFVEEAASAYLEVVQQDPSRQAAWQALVDARIESGDWRDAVSAIEDALGAHPGNEGLALLRIHLLAAAPEPGIRDAARANALARELWAAETTLPRGEALAMALAASGQYEDAAALQQRLVETARDANRLDLLAGLEPKLDRYRAGQPWRLDLR